MKRSLIATVSALVIASSFGAPAIAHFKTSQLLEIETLIASNSWVKLRKYILAHPELLEGDDSLATELTSFMVASSGFFGLLKFDNPPLPNLDNVNVEDAIY